MNTMILKGKWRQTKGAVQERWGDLRDDDVLMLLGEKEQLVGRVQERYGYTQEQAQQEVASFLNSLRAEGSTVSSTVESAVSGIQEKSTEAIQEHPWYASMFFGAVTLLIGGYILNRFFAPTEIQNRSGEKQSQTAA